MSTKLNLDSSNSLIEYALEIFDLTKTYKLKGKDSYIKALNKINFKVRKNEIFGLLGPNGAGKTTLVSILTTLIQPTNGYAKILGYNILEDPWFVKENIGLMFGGDMVYLRLTGYRNLKFFCKLYGIKDYKNKINSLTERLGIKNWLSEYVGNYSQGMKLKLALVRVLLTEPKILFLDEPMLGLDPNIIVEVIEILRNLNITIILTSHQMDIVSKLCDRIAFLKEGKILKIDTQENFRKLITDKIKIQIELLENNNDLINILNQLEFVSDIKEDQNLIIFFIENNKYFPKLLSYLKDYPIKHFSEIKPTLDDVFIKLAK